MESIKPIEDRPAPKTWEEFLEIAVEVHVRKDTDYESRFMKALTDKDLDGKTLWAWEVTKKLDRLRTWVKRGELTVKGEGILDSVIDLSNYTVQFYIYRTHTYPMEHLSRESFAQGYKDLFFSGLARYLTKHNLLNLIDCVDLQVYKILLKYWGVE